MILTPRNQEFPWLSSSPFLGNDEHLETKRTMSSSLCGYAGLGLSVRMRETALGGKNNSGGFGLLLVLIIQDSNGKNWRFHSKEDCARYSKVCSHPQGLKTLRNYWWKVSYYMNLPINLYLCQMISPNLFFGDLVYVQFRYHSNKFGYEKIKWGTLCWLASILDFFFFFFAI